MSGQLLEESVDFSTQSSNFNKSISSMWTTPRGVCGLFNFNYGDRGSIRDVDNS